LLAKADEAHQTPSGPTTKKILEREFQQYHHVEYERLASISVAHIYNLRRRPHYRECGMSHTKTRPVQVVIGERPLPEPAAGQAICAWTPCTKGTWDGVKGVYHN